MTAGAIRMREWCKRNPDKVMWQKSKELAKKNGSVPMPLEECRKALAARSLARGCAICEADTKLVADHDHYTGKFRGWLCRTCNLAEGYLRSPENALRLADYMEAG